MISTTQFILAVLLSNTPTELPPLPEPTDEHVYCWLSIERDDDKNLVGFNEDCNE